jgi:hypothetical protein
MGWPPPARQSSPCGPWSVIAAIPIAGGTVWFKASPPASSFEPALTVALADWSPGSALVPLAVDSDRAWMLLPDGGHTLASALAADDHRFSLHQWPGLLAGYTRLQRTLMAHDDNLLTLGISDFRPPVIPGIYDELLEAAALEPGERQELAV